MRRLPVILTVLFVILLSLPVSAQGPVPDSPDGGANSPPRSSSPGFANSDKLPAPTLSGSKSPNRVDLSWSAVSGAVKYDLWYWTSATGHIRLSNTLTGLTYTHSELTAGRNYQYWVRAISSSGAEGNWSNSVLLYVNGPPALLPPRMSAPSLSGNASNRSITVSWSSVSGATGYRLTHWIASRGSWQRIGGIHTGTSHTHSNLSYGVTYYYSVSAVNSHGTGAWSNHSNMTLTQPAAATATDTPVSVIATNTPISGQQNPTNTPVPPTNTPLPTATPVPKPSLRGWTDGTAMYLSMIGFANVTHYEVWKREFVPDYNGWSSWKRISISGSTHTDRNVRLSAQYEYKVHAQNRHNQRIGTWSNTLRKTMPDPTPTPTHTPTPTPNWARATAIANIMTVTAEAEATMAANATAIAEQCENAEGAEAVLCNPAPVGPTPPAWLRDVGGNARGTPTPQHTRRPGDG